MSVASRLALLALAVGAFLLLYQWQLTTRDPQQVTDAALRQFENSNAVTENLRIADSAKHWWLIAGTALLLALATILFWDDVETWWNERDQRAV
jgi:hypothetical protein